MVCGERYVSRRQETCLQEGYAARLRDGCGGAYCIWPLVGVAHSTQSANGAGDPTVSMLAACSRGAADSTCLDKARKRTPAHSGALARTYLRCCAEGRAY